MANLVNVVSYHPEWIKMFESEAAKIKQALGKNCIEVHHIGSTSVPGLSAKPVIDILPVVLNLKRVDEAEEAMKNLGYLAKGEYGIPFRRYFQKGQVTRTHNVHIFEKDDPTIEQYLKFRDWMKSHPDDQEAYTKLKITLAEKFPEDIDSYCSGKEEFIKQISAKFSIQD